MVVDMARVKVAASGTDQAAWEPVGTTAAFAPDEDCFTMATAVSARVAERVAESECWVKPALQVPDWVRRSISLPAMPRPWRRPVRLNQPDRPLCRPRSSRIAAIRGARSAAIIRTWAASDAGSAADRSEE